MTAIAIFLAVNVGLPWLTLWAAVRLAPKPKGLK